MYNNDKFDLQVLKINTESNQTTDSHYMAAEEGR